MRMCIFFDIFKGATSRQVMLALHCTSDFNRAEGLGNEPMKSAVMKSAALCSDEPTTSVM